MTLSITFDKGVFTGGSKITLNTVEVSEDYTNKLILSIPTILQEQKQSGPLPEKKIIDLLWITHTLQIRGDITPTASKTAKEIRDDLVTLFKGAQTDGGSIVMTYGGDTINGYIEKMVIIEKASDYDPSSDAVEKSDYQDVAKYGIQITFVEGKSPSGG